MVVFFIFINRGFNQGEVYRSTPPCIQNVPPYTDNLPPRQNLSPGADRVLSAGDGRDRKDGQRSTPRDLQAGCRLHQRRQVLSRPL